ncbi:hypothetical protein FHS43_001061 [Streptosporangium becharense]|uniref:Aromatic prenyltransferase, DMATS type n=1 Tax=Streptosporangium becharense TaxID=1816182 RepID=A0A7W9IEY0_9ACTN|nr:hypothetical protein [Streptosporangium becharense]MBB2909815.1 hypothetical protein [Streptosporangium becharense]MBB5819230.1 hypothetical protein [Streptosporangium becharense]
MAATNPTPTTRLAAAFGDLAVRLGVRDDPATTAEELLRITGEPHRHSILTDSAVPVEVSVKLDERGTPSLRCVVDLLGHRPDDWGPSLEQARSVTGCRTVEHDACLADLFRTHLTGAPADLPAPVMLGLGHGTGGRSRGTVYFRTSWLDPDELAARLPLRMETLREADHRYGSGLPASVEVLGYDLVDGELTSWKSYRWLPAAPGRDLGDLAGTHPDLLPARRVHDRFVSAARPRPSDRSLFLQVTHGPAGTRQKVFFFCSAWGWDGPDGLSALLGLLHREFDHDLGPLLRLREATAAHGVAVRLGLIAVGGDPRRPRLTFYFWPVTP